MNAPKKRRSSIGMSSRAAEIIDLDEEGAEKTDDAPCLFVMEAPPSCDEELANFHETLFGVMEKQNIQPKMISRSEVLAVPRSTPDIYVLPIFEGPEYDHLMDKKCKVIGPFVVDRCIKMENRLPKWRHAIYALSMEGAVVCFSGLAKKKKADLSELVRRLGGQVSNDLHDKVTVLISKNCNTAFPKYTESAKLKLPILREDWITDAWKSVIDNLNDEPVTTPTMYDQYRVPLFKDMVITVSGLNVTERSNAGNLIEMGCGEFTPEMSKTRCTHLITDRNSGDKFKKAREWQSGIRIVTLKWLLKSVEMGYVQKEAHYDPERVRASTPTKGAKPPDDLDFSMVAPPPAGPGGLNNTTISSGINSSLNMTVRTPNDCSVVKPSFMRHDSSRRVGSMDSSTMEEGRVVDATKDIDMATMNGDEDFFEGLRIFLIGVPEVRETWWKKMLNWSGATRATRVEMATHVVAVGGVVDKSVFSCGVPVLTTEWVVACMNNKRVMPHGDFVYSSTSSTCLNQSLISSVNGPLKKTPAKASQGPRARGGATSQQMPAVPSVSTASTTVPQSSLRRSTNVPPPSSSVGARHVFKGVTFKLSGAISQEEGESLRGMIADGGGSVVAPSASAHYLVCTLLDYGTVTCPSDHKTQDIVSVFWLYRCLDAASLESPSSHPLFRPLPACRESMVFGGLLVALVGFDYEQEMYAYETLLVQYGAEIAPQGNRSRARAVTHTIAGGPMKERGWTMTGQKPLDPSWIIECIVHDKILLEDNFMFKSTAYSQYAGRKDDLWEWERLEERREERSRGGREGAISGLRNGTVLEEHETGGDNSEMIDLGQFDGDEGGEQMDRTEGMEEEDSMVREITEEMEMDGGMEAEERGGVKTQQLPSSASSTATSSRTPRGKSAATPSTLTHPRLQMLRTVATPSSPSHRSIPTTSSPTQFLHPNARPKLIIPGVEEYLDQISSPAQSEADRSYDQLSASGVGRMLDTMVVTTGRMNEMMETPIRGTSVLEEREQREREDREMDLLMNGRPSIGARRNILDSSRLERRGGRREGEGEDWEDEETTDYPATAADSRETNETEETMEVDSDDDDSPRDSIVAIPPELDRRRKEVEMLMKASLANSKKKQEEEKEKAEKAATASTSASGEKEKGVAERRIGGGLGLRGRRKRLNMAELPGNEAKRAPVPPTELKTGPLNPAPPRIDWAVEPHVYKDNADETADDTNLFGSPIKAPPIRRDPTMPSTSTVKTTVANRSVAGRESDWMGGSARPMVTPAKTLRARAPPPMDDKTQEVERGGALAGEKTARKSKSTAAISRRGRGKENGEKTRVFAFTSIGDAELRDRLTEAVRALGGSFSQSDDFDATLTHVVCGKIVRNEKLLMATAASLLIVKPSYILDSQKAGKWLLEDEYEWCNNTEPLTENKDRKTVEAIVRWKRDIQAQRSTLLVEGREGKVGAFVSWRVVFYALTRDKVASLMRIVRAGGGEAHFREDVQRNDIGRLQPTHALVDGSMLNANGVWNVEELRFVHSLGARAFPLDFLFKFMTHEKIDQSSYYLPEYKKMLACE